MVSTKQDPVVLMNAVENVYLGMLTLREAIAKLGIAQCSPRA